MQFFIVYLLRNHRQNLVTDHDNKINVLPAVQNFQRTKSNEHYS
jgi:hypothetical protein